jgi:hypothetical protein
MPPTAQAYASPSISYSRHANVSQILLHSVEKEYFLTNLPWLIGSLGTMVEDATIFVQFRIYGEGSSSAVV